MEFSLLHKAHYLALKRVLIIGNFFKNYKSRLRIYPGSSQLLNNIHSTKYKETKQKGIYLE